MANPITIRMGGYGPPTTGFFSKAIKFIGDRLEKQFGDRVDDKYCWNIMDFGYKAGEGNPAAGRKRHSHARPSVVELLPHRPRS